jgi:NAD(P)-dependent dehydrogenase (short-subunit alcohol dehydrogenase family)
VLLLDKYKQFERCALLSIADVIDYASYPSVVTWVQDTLGSDQGLNVLINNAAIANWEQSLTSITHELMMAELEANAVAPLMLSKVVQIAVYSIVFVASNGS